MNLQILSGYIGKDAELKTFDDGGQVINLSLATTKNWKSKDGEKQSKTFWHDVKLRGKNLENFAKYLTKGKAINVYGSHEYTEKEGKYYHYCNANEITFAPTVKEVKQHETKQDKEDNLPF